jgi:hypothetical protein
MKHVPDSLRIGILMGAAIASIIAVYNRSLSAMKFVSVLVSF